MMCRAQQREGATQRAHSVAGQTPPAVEGAIHAAEAGLALDPFAHAEEVRRRHPFAAGSSGIRHEVEGARLSFAANQTVKHQTPVFANKHKRTKPRILGLQGANAHRFAIADGWVHARPARVEGHGRALAQQSFNYFLGIGHGVLGPQSERYRKP